MVLFPAPERAQGRIAHWADGEASLVALARAGDMTAFEALLRKYEYLIRARARRFFLQGAEYEDLVQEGLIGLFKAIRDFREAGSTFRAFADLCISRQIITAVKTASRLKHYPLNSAFSLEAPRFDDEDGRTLGDMIGERADPLDTAWLEEEEVRVILAILKRHLSPFEFKTLMLWLEGRSYENIAQLQGKHFKSVDNGLWRVKCKIRKLLSKGIIPAADSRA